MTIHHAELFPGQRAVTYRSYEVHSLAQRPADFFSTALKANDKAFNLNLEALGLDDWVVRFLKTGIGTAAADFCRRGEHLIVLTLLAGLNPTDDQETLDELKERLTRYCGSKFLPDFSSDALSHRPLIVAANFFYSVGLFDPLGFELPDIRDCERGLGVAFFAALPQFTPE